MLNHFLVISKSINFAACLLKWPSKNKGPTRGREISIKLIKSNCNWLLFQSGNYNCSLVPFFAK